LNFTPTLRDRLAAGWVSWYCARANDLGQQLDGLSGRSDAGHAAADLNPAVRDLLQVISGCTGRLADVHRHLRDRYADDDDGVVGLYASSEELFRDEGSRDVGQFVRELIETYLMSSWHTKCGRYIWWFDSLHGRIEKFAIDPGQFPAGFAAEEYWRRLPSDLPSGWGYAVKASDIPVHPHVVAEQAYSLPVADNTDQANEAADALLDEAVAGKRFTIPANATVEFAFGPFSAVQVHELEFEVVFKFCTPSGEFYLASVFPTYHNCTFTIPITSKDVDWDKKRAIGAGVKLFLAAVVRDFWVLEEREAAFGHRPRRGGAPISSEDAPEGPRVVYLPRVRISLRADIQACQDALGHRERRTHFVSGHLRRSEYASPKQMILAERHGYAVPSGYTFVRPHERGRGVQEVIYRSRSALRSLYVAEPDAGGEGGVPDWFQFEREVQALMTIEGFTVEHVSASRRGDGGVDVFATKGRDLDQVNWIIQCKHSARGRKVGPAVVRELVGVLTRYPPGTRGMIVTATSFTSKAAEEAGESGIRLMDGVEFRRRIAGVTGSGPAAAQEG
jgi:hypothetical protein